MPAQVFGERQHDVGGENAGARQPFEFDADDLGEPHPDGPPEHHRFGLDPADAPAQNPQSVDHRRVAIGADERIGKSNPVLAHDDGRKFFEIDLMQDAVSRHHDVEVFHRLLRPGKEFKTLGVLAVFTRPVARQRIRLRSAHFDIERMVDHELGRHGRIDLARIAALFRHGVAQGREVDKRRCAQQILQNDPRRIKRKVRPRFPNGDFTQRSFKQGLVGAAQDVFGKHPARKRHPFKMARRKALDIFLNRNVQTILSRKGFEMNFHEISLSCLWVYGILYEKNAK